ncbi:hypothetical protein Slin14017_G125390 [Septoria linicola]|nr:hypothetical protein Slin14017_G125390 [Septoria linicola]
MAAPGGNAFAQKEHQRERYQLAGNAFAQQEFAQRKMTPPGMVHPAFRRACNLLDTTKALPELDPVEVQHHLEHSPQRESSQTTMTQFIQSSPELDLGTTPEHTPIPTQREWLETRDNLELHGGRQSYIPVFKHTPKSTAEEFAAAVNTTPTGNATARPQTPAGKSPKKGFFERMSKWTGRRAQSQTPRLNTDVDRTSDPHMPPKARAVLQEVPPPRNIVRSPSKTKSFFSRRQSDASEVKRPEPPRAATSLGHRTPRSVHFESPQPSAPQSRNVSGTSFFQRTPILGRSKSLKCLDSPIPPTPPAKDTPPDQVPLRHVSEHPLTPFATETPRRAGNLLSSGRLSPSRIGSNGSRGAATLVTQPSMYSFRASVVPGAMDQSDLDDANTRLRGLAIEGFSMPHETRCDSEAMTYSPSIYSPDQFRRSVARFPERRDPGLLLAQLRREAGKEAQLDQVPRTDSPHTTQSSTSDTGTISMVYPELAKDPSIASFMKYDIESSPAQPGEADRAFDEVEQMLKPKEPAKSNHKTVARERRDSERTIRGEYTIATPTSTVSELSADGLFAVAVKRVQNNELATPKPSFVPATLSAASPEHSTPMAHHPSAMPSPLRTLDGEHYLPATVYTPTQQPRSRKQPKMSLKLPKVIEKKSSEALLSPYDAPWTPGGRPKPKEDIFSKQPSLIPRPQEGLVVRQSPPIGGTRWSKDGAASTGDPEKSPTVRKVSPSKSIVESAVAAIEEQEAQQASFDDPDAHKSYNDLMEMITVRDDAIRRLETEVKVETTRLHHRLASVEIKERERAKMPEVCYGDEGKKRASTDRKTSSTSHTISRRGSAEKRPVKRRQPEIKRISTSFAHDFYQKPSSHSESNSPVDSIPISEQSTIILTPNLPKVPPLPSLPPPLEQPREDSPTLPAGSPGPVATAVAEVALPEASAPVDSAMSSPVADAKYNELIAVVQQQQTMMMQMMQEIKDLKRAGKEAVEKSDE